MEPIGFLEPVPVKTMAYIRADTTRHEWEAMTDIADRKAVGGRIKALRKARHWPMKQLANMIGIRYEQLNKYESGLNTPPLDTLAKIADALDTTMDYLVTGTPMEQAKFANARLFRRLQALDQLDEEGQQALIRILDALITQQRVTSALASVD